MDDYIFYSYGLMLLALIISLIAQGYVNGSYKKYSKILNRRNLKGFDVARKILDENGLQDVSVEEVTGILSDHYDPTKKAVCLSQHVFSGQSITSCAVAAHECGHAIQDKEFYTPLRIRSSIVPIVNIASCLGYVAIVVGAFFSFFNLILIGILFEVIIVLFQIITLPVEFNASSRALREIEKYELLTSDELRGGKSMLRAAAFTYVASVLATLLQILRLVLMYGRRHD